MSKAAAINDYGTRSWKIERPLQGPEGKEPMNAAIFSDFGCETAFLACMDKRQWEVITRTELTAFTVGIVLFIALLIRSTPGFVPVLDYANLLFHEAGHPLIKYISPQLEPYGGTIAQLLLPCLLIANFWSARKVLGTAVGGIWLCENFLNIARYMADARTMVLPLVGGGHHDWSTIFRRWDILQYDTEIAFVVTIVAWTGIAVCSMWVFWRARQSRFFVRASMA